MHNIELNNFFESDKPTPVEYTVKTIGKVTHAKRIHQSTKDRILMKPKKNGIGWGLTRKTFKNFDTKCLKKTSSMISKMKTMIAEHLDLH